MLDTLWCSFRVGGYPVKKPNGIRFRSEFVFFNAQEFQQKAEPNIISALFLSAWTAPGCFGHLQYSQNTLKMSKKLGRWCVSLCKRTHCDQNVVQNY